MSGGLPESFDAARLTPSQTQLSGRIELARLRRLGELLADTAGQVDVRLQCGRDPDGRPTLEGNVSAELRVVCQRCLEPLPLTVDSTLGVALVETEGEAGRVAPPREPLLLVEGSVPLYALIEDELLLAVPFAPLHADPVDCGRLARELKSYQSGPTEDHYRPFAGLAEQMHRRRK